MEKFIGNFEARLKRCEEDIKELKGYRDECSENNNKTKNDLVKTIQKIDDLIKTVEKLPESLEKSMLKSIEIQEKEHEKIYSQIKELKDDNNKMQDELDNLKQLIDDRTVNEDSDNYRQIKITIVITIITAILSFVIGLILKWGVKDDISKHSSISVRNTVLFNFYVVANMMYNDYYENVKENEELA